jgi:hypothetical protein
MCSSGALVRLVKTGIEPGQRIPADEPRQAPVPFGACEHVQDLKRVLDLLTQLDDALSRDLAVLDRHGVALQNLDIASQLVSALAGIGAESCSPDDDPTTLAGLRRSADQALLNTL